MSQFPSRTSGFRAGLAAASCFLGSLSAGAQSTPAASQPPASGPAQVSPQPQSPGTQPHDSAPGLPRGDGLPPGRGILRLSATFSNNPTLVRAGLQWRIFDAAAAPDGTHRLVAQSIEAQPRFNLAEGPYIVHATFGYASTMKRVAVADAVAIEQVNLNAGGIEIAGTIGDSPISPDRLSFSIFVPEHNNPEAKLVVAEAKPGQVIRLPEGTYHVVSTYLDTVGVGSLTPVSKTNSVVSADLRVQAGKLVTATLRHRAATLTLKLVNAPGGEALANSSFTILTPGGDVIRELIGAFPSLVLAEGDYVAIARNQGRTYQSEFKVQSGQDRDIEVIAK